MEGRKKGKEEALTQQLLLAKDGRERTGTAARVAEDYAELGYTYVALDLDWPRDSLSGEMCCPDAIHVTIGYLPRMSPGEQAHLRRRLSLCLAAWLRLHPAHRPHDERVLYTRRWRLRPSVRLADMPPASFGRLLCDNLITDPWITDDSDFDGRVQELYGRDRERFEKAVERARGLADNQGSLVVAHRRGASRDGRSCWTLDPERCAELHDLLQNLCVIA